MEFVKMEGLGNDFVVIPGPFTPHPEDVRAWCRRRTGIGADGVIVVEPVDRTRVRMHYWNADGGRAEMCGNGLRCVATFARDSDLVDGLSFTVVTDAGELPVECRADGLVRAAVGRPHQHRVSTLQVAGVELHPVGLGNPHAVMFVPDPDTAPVKTLGPRIERDPMFPGGANVEFVTVVAEDRIRVRTWERGSGETQACGTGAAAAAYVAHRRGEAGSRVAVELLGGTLVIEILDNEVWMEGPAREVFRGTLPALTPPGEAAASNPAGSARTRP